MIRLILFDINANYKLAGGGGVSQIRETATNEFEVRLPQEERIDVIRYELRIDASCHIVVQKKENFAITQGNR